MSTHVTCVFDRKEDTETENRQFNCPGLDGLHSIISFSKRKSYPVTLRDRPLDRRRGRRRGDSRVEKTPSERRRSRGTRPRFHQLRVVTTTKTEDRRVMVEKKTRKIRTPIIIGERQRL